MGVQLNSYSAIKKPKEEIDLKLFSKTGNYIFLIMILYFLFENAEYGVQCSKNISIMNCFQEVGVFHFKEAEKGNAYAQYKLSRFFRRSDKYKEAIKYLELAAQQGIINACLRVLVVYIIIWKRSTSRLQKSFSIL